jgi:hypothetical protein
MWYALARRQDRNCGTEQIVCSHRTGQTERRRNSVSSIVDSGTTTLSSGATAIVLIYLDLSIGLLSRRPTIKLSKRV